MAKEFIDLGLPSGNLWATENEVAENGQPLYATFDEAVKQFGENLPTQDDWQELLDNVPHLWDKKRDGLLFVARNGKSCFCLLWASATGRLYTMCETEATIGLLRRTTFTAQNTCVLALMRYTQIQVLVATTGYQSALSRKEANNESRGTTMLGLSV